MYVWYSTEVFDFGSMRFSQKCLGRNKFEPPDEYDCHRGELDRSTIHRYGVGTCCSSPSTTMPCQVSGRPCNATLDQNCLRFLRAQWSIDQQCHQTCPQPNIFGIYIIGQRVCRRILPPRTLQAPATELQEE